MENIDIIIDEQIKLYIPIAQAIAQTFGENCEVVLHDFSSPQNSVVYVLNNSVTGRQVGQPFEHIIKQVLLSKNFKNDVAANYKSESNNKTIKSTTVILRNFENDPIGALCINIDITQMKELKKFVDQYMPKEVEKISDDNFSNVQEIVDELIDKIISKYDTNIINREQRRELVRFMEEKGVFLTKGALDKVSEKLKVSKVTLYSDLEEIKNNKKNYDNFS